LEFLKVFNTRRATAVGGRRLGKWHV